ncbi:MAG TPA: glycosyltransferase family 2 protein, partial [Legionellales bacterium]|nr:glycosyltransferase family 2 protein [Legionellales bacterium]
MLSVIIITKNEAHNIERCLQSVAFAQEIIVVDSGSTDSTAIIAKRFTPYVYTH